MTSGTTGEAAIFGVPSLLLCPTLKPGGPHSGWFSELAEDGLVEAIELTNTSDHPFILGVQWHPERMNPENSLSGPVAKRFILEISKFHGQK